MVGSDINPVLLAQARAGRYSLIETNRGLSPHIVSRYLIAKDGGYQVRDDVRERAAFYERNILDPWYPFKSDIILCRNTLIYFDIADRIKALARFHRALSNHGYLLLGTAEGTRHLHTGFAPTEINGANIFTKINNAFHEHKVD